MEVAAAPASWTTLLKEAKAPGGGHCLQEIRQLREEVSTLRKRLQALEDKLAEAESQVGAERCEADDEQEVEDLRAKKARLSHDATVFEKRLSSLVNELRSAEALRQSNGDLNGTEVDKRMNKLEEDITSLMRTATDMTKRLELIESKDENSNDLQKSGDQLVELATVRMDKLENGIQVRSPEARQLYAANGEAAALWSSPSFFLAAVRTSSPSGSSCCLGLRCCYSKRYISVEQQDLLIVCSWSVRQPPGPTIKGSQVKHLVRLREAKVVCRQRVVTVQDQSMVLDVRFDTPEVAETFAAHVGRRGRSDSMMLAEELVAKSQSATPEEPRRHADPATGSTAKPMEMQCKADPAIGSTAKPRVFEWPSREARPVTETALLDIGNSGRSGAHHSPVGRTLGGSTQGASLAPKALFRENVRGTATKAMPSETGRELKMLLEQAEAMATKLTDALSPTLANANMR